MTESMPFSARQCNSSHQKEFYERIQKYSVYCLRSAFGDSNKQGSVPNLNPWDKLLLVGHVKGYTEDNMIASIQDTMFSVSPTELRHAMNNEFVRCDLYL
jgi:hypothetical protein